MCILVFCQRIYAKNKTKRIWCWLLKVLNPFYESSQKMTMTNLFLCYLVTLIATSMVNAANILVLCPITSHSHAFYTKVLVDALAIRGHKLTVLSPDKFENNNPNITAIYLEGGYDQQMANVTLEDLSQMFPSEGFMDHTNLVLTYTVNTCRLLLFSDGNKRFYEEYKNHKFDLILNDIGSLECFLKYTHVFGNPPIVGYTAFFSIHGNNLGDFENPAYVPHFMSTLTNQMTFMERLANWLQFKYFGLMRRFWLHPKLDEISEKFFGFYTPTIEELESRITVALTNEHFSITYPKPRVPASIPVGGLHIKPAKPLPQDIEKIVSDAREGIIFFSLGSNLLSKYMTDKKKRLFLEAFAQLPQRVLWKYEDDDLTDIPPNVLTRKWFPQTDVLAHNNTVLFITHNGFLSTQESIYFGVPMLGMPLVTDQYKNNRNIMKRGIGRRLNLNGIENSQQILDEIRAILHNPSYKQNAQKVSNFFRDRPMPPLDTAVYWIEYVLRHKGADHLRVASLDLYWYQYYLLDIYLTIVAVVCLLYWAVTKFLGCVISKINSVVTKKYKRL